MKIKYLTYTILGLGFTFLILYRISKNKTEKEGSGNFAKGGKSGMGSVMHVTGIVVKPEKFDNSLSLSGSIEANEQVQLRSQISGLVQKIGFNEGGFVKEGQLLVKIDDGELQAQLSQALTKQNLASENERRAGLLLKKGAISQEEYEIAQADLKALQSQTQLIRAQLAKTSIKAPFSGKIGLRSISTGQYLSPDMVVANLVNTNPVKITFSVPEKYSNQVKVNSDLSFTIAGSNKKYTAKVYAIEPQINASTRTLQLRAKAANPSGELLPGTFANIQLPLTTLENALLVPTEAIIPIQNGKKVFISHQGKAKEALIETSTRTDKDVLITSGLNPGDTVLTTGIMSLKPGTPVKVKTTEK